MRTPEAATRYLASMLMPLGRRIRAASAEPVHTGVQRLIYAPHVASLSLSSTGYIGIGTHLFGVFGWRQSRRLRPAGRIWVKGAGDHLADSLRSAPVGAPRRATRS